MKEDFDCNQHKEYYNNLRTTYYQFNKRIATTDYTPLQNEKSDSHYYYETSFTRIPIKPLLITDTTLSALLAMSFEHSHILLNENTYYIKDIRDVKDTLFNTIVFQLGTPPLKTKEHSRTIMNRYFSKRPLNYQTVQSIGKSLGFHHRCPFVSGYQIFVPEKGSSNDSTSWYGLHHALDAVEDKKGNTPLASTNYKELIDNKDLDCVFVVSDWTSHVEICLAGLENGLYVATEVGGATSINQCWELVRTSERTGKPCMMLENCCYNREEMTVLNMVKKGLFGELVHCEGGYRHDLRDEVALGNVNRHYRLKNYKHRNGDVYPTHEIGPIAKYLDINRGNRFISLTSTASKSVGIPQWIKDNKGEDFENANFKFALGDVVTTVIKCAHGETITLYHDTSLPRPYSRANLVQGTKGIWSEDKHAIYIEGLSPKGNNWWGHEWDDIENYYEKSFRFV